MRAASVPSDLIARYVNERHKEGVASSTINGELAALKRMYRLGLASTPPKIYRVPAFPHPRSQCLNKRRTPHDTARLVKLAALLTATFNLRSNGA